MTRPVNPGERPPYVFDQFHGDSKYSRYFYLRIGRVMEVDLDRYRMRIEWIQGAGSPGWMPISFPYLGPSGCIGAVPEEGAYGIFGYYNEGIGKGAPLCLAYIPSGLGYAIEYNTIKRHPDAVSNEDENIISYKFRKMSKGDVIVGSPLGGNLFANADVELSDQMQDSIRLRYADQSIISSSVNNFMFTDGVLMAAGPAMRNLMNIYDTKGNKIPNTNGSLLTLQDGRDVVYLVPYGKEISYDTQMYNEYRLSVDELVDGMLDTNEVNSGNASSERDPVVTMTMGNYIEHLETDPSKYGQILRPVLFANPDDTDGQFNLVRCAQNKGRDEVSTLGLAYAMNFHGSGAFMGVDKEGQYHMFLPASKSNPSGGGRSMSIVARGNKKEIWGRDVRGMAWDFGAKGGIRWDVDNAGPEHESRSIDIRTTSGVYYEYNGEDDSGFAKQESVMGDTLEYVGGEKTSTVSGASTLTIEGLKTEKVFGSSHFEVQTDHSVNVLGTFKETVVKEKQCQFGKRKTTVSGNDEHIVQKGDLTQTIQIFGNKKTEFKGPGGISQEVLTGNIESTIKAGNYSLDIKAGKIEQTVSVGSIKMEAPTFEANGKLKAAVKGLSVKLGNVGHGGVITTLSHFDYVTGAPLKGSTTVKAAL